MRLTAEERKRLERGEAEFVEYQPTPSLFYIEDLTEEERESAFVRYNTLYFERDGETYVRKPFQSFEKDDLSDTHYVTYMDQHFCWIEPDKGNMKADNMTKLPKF